MADSRSIGYMIMLFPTVFIIARFGPGYWLPACEVRLQSRLSYHIADLQVIWGCLTCVLSTAKNAETVRDLTYDADRIADLWPQISDRVLRSDMLARLQHHHQRMVSAP
jgi:hypothetical protein